MYPLSSGCGNLHSTIADTASALVAISVASVYYNTSKLIWWYLTMSPTLPCHPTL